MKKFFGLLLMLGLITTAAAQKTIRDANAQKRNVSGFHAIEVSGGIDLYLSQGEEAVAVSAAKDEYRDKIITEVKNGVLKIWFDWKNNYLLTFLILPPPVLRSLISPFPL